jgi:hypothetical protein
MMIRKTALALLLGAAAFSAMADDNTVAVRIDGLLANGVSNEFLVSTTTKLGVAACPDAQNVSLPSNLVQRDKLIELLIQAKLWSRSVSFGGSCAASPAFFTATRVILR